MNADSYLGLRPIAYGLALAAALSLAIVGMAVAAETDPGVKDPTARTFCGAWSDAFCDAGRVLPNDRSPNARR